MTQQQMDDFIGRELDKVAKKMRKGIGPADMPQAIGKAVELLIEKIYDLKG